MTRDKSAPLRSPAAGSTLNEAARNGYDREEPKRDEAGAARSVPFSWERIGSADDCIYLLYVLY
ncbi:hypothetical protein B8V81_1354 [Paenibacillus pasadenensis]|uniref:Uncharacterized protein n=1 Tax=Paenibacillus pasadenensis TaxID=217090 RepID=A0A2N5NA18_9BACL|nr:hypothetical protein B8V81_1354 [Paenibacillus pasadenensis]